MMMSNQYKLIHIDTLEETLCEKITIEGKDYYVVDYHIDNHWKIKKSDNSISSSSSIRESGYNNYYTIIATTNTSLQCPQVVDYEEELADKGYRRYIAFCKEDILHFVKWSKYYKLLDNTKSDSEYSYEELFNLFKSTLPTKIYYR
jgi:hypothetical protein